ncbi:MAG: hypothetical protein IPI53_03290 [Saprospiraceae bacterium]|nr:hypothetical protein [Saprospiraceae bacterium]
MAGTYIWTGPDSLVHNTGAGRAPVSRGGSSITGKFKWNISIVSVTANQL